MEGSIEDNQLVLSATGMEFLRLKTELVRRLGDTIQTGTSYIKIPTSAIPMIADLLPSDIKDIDSIQKHLSAFERHAEARHKSLAIIEKNDNLDIPSEWLNVLDPPQATAVNAMTIEGILGLCLFDEQGSGKTVMAIAAFDILKERGFVDKMIVVCPKSMINEWPKDVNRFLKGKYKTLQAEGTKKEKYDAALSDFEILVTNYEGIEVMLTSLIAGSNRFRYLLVVDESYYLKNGNAARSNNVSKLRSFCERCFVLCGTPAPNSAHDLLHQFDLADLGFTFAGFAKSKEPSDDWGKIADLVESRGLFIRRLKQEILSHVPEKEFHVLRVRLKGRQALMYEKARSELELELRTLDNEKFRKSLITYFQRRSALLQICTCPNSLDPTITETPVKYEVLDSLISRLTLEGRKIVLWSFFRKSIDELMERYRLYKPVRVDGSVPSSARRMAVISFQEDPQTLLFIGNPSAAGAGITLHASYDAIYLSYSNQAAPYLQSLDRIHRRGQRSDRVNYYLVVCENTIEEKEIVRLRQKEVTQHRLLGDHIPWPTSLDDALQELLIHG